MARPKDYRDLIVWQKAMVLARTAYANTARFPKNEAYGLISQIRRAAVSIPSNIAEGHGRLTDSQFRHFPGNARGSIYELRTQCELAGDLGYIEREAVQHLMEQSGEVARIINGLIASLSTERGERHFSNSASTASEGNQR